MAVSTYVRVYSIKITGKNFKYKLYYNSKTGLFLKKKRRGLVKMTRKMGEWAFIIGVLVAVIIGLFSGSLQENTSGWLILLLVILGLIVGFLNISESETTPFLVAAVALLITGTASESLRIIPTIGGYLA